MKSFGLDAKKYVTVLGRKIAYIEEGHGPLIVFLHGNPTSSYIWRNIIPHMSSVARCVLPDLIGMGDSEKLPGDDPERYSFKEHQKFIQAFLEKIADGENVILVGQDWGGVLAMDWARRHEESVRGIVYFETIVRTRTWAELDPIVSDSFKRLRSSEGEKMVLEDNFFVEQILPARVLNKLSDVHLEEYRRPFLSPGEDRRPTLSFPREIPIDGLPVHSSMAVSAYADWMANNEIPKLFINGEPGAILVGPMREFCRTWPNQEELTVKGSHFLQEDSPDEIGRAIASWMSRHFLDAVTDQL